MENGPFEDVFPIKDGDIPASYVSLPEGKFDLSTIRSSFFFGTSPKSSITSWICVFCPPGDRPKRMVPYSGGG